MKLPARRSLATTAPGGNGTEQAAHAPGQGNLLAYIDRCAHVTPCIGRVVRLLRDLVTVLGRALSQL